MLGDLKGDPDFRELLMSMHKPLATDPAADGK